MKEKIQTMMKNSHKDDIKQDDRVDEEENCR